MADLVGQQLGNYRLIRLLGRGGFAEVYLGEHQRLKTQAAIKVLRTQLADDDIEGFLKEARTVAHLEHPHIVRILDFDVEESTPFLVMSYAPNGNLRQHYAKGTILPLGTIISYVKQIGAALQYAHNEKLIHRDIKPENMLVGRHNDILLSDFGIALVAQSSRFQSTQEVTGTAAYMSPEQLQGKPRVASDQYSLGIVVYEWLCGERPFSGTFTELYSQHLFVPPPPLNEKVPTIPLAIEQVVLKALAKDPRQRFTTVQEFVSALEQFSHPKPILLSTSPSHSPASKPSTSPSDIIIEGEFENQDDTGDFIKDQDNASGFVDDSHLPIHSSVEPVSDEEQQGIPATSHIYGVRPRDNRTDKAVPPLSRSAIEDNNDSSLPLDQQAAISPPRAWTRASDRQPLSDVGMGNRLPQPVALPQPQAHAQPKPGQPAVKKRSTSNRPATRAIPRSIRQPQQARKKASSSRIVMPILLVLTLLIIVLLAFLVPSAEVTVTFLSQSFPLQMTLTATASSRQDVIQQTLPAQTLTFDTSVTGPGHATGRTIVGTKSATGNVVFTNTGTTTIVIPTGIIISTKDGVLFVTQAEPEVLAGNPIVTPVKAQNPGASGNVPANSITVIPPDSQTRILQANPDITTLTLSVNNTDPTIGGEGAGSAPSVTTNDAHTEKAVLDSQVQAQVKGFLKKNVYASDQQGTPIQVETSVAVPAVGNIATDGTFTETLKLHMTVLVVRAADLQAAAVAQLKDALTRQKRGLTLVPQQPVELKQLNNLPAKDGHALVLKFTAVGQVAPQVSEDAVRNLVSGKSLDAAQHALVGANGIPKVVDSQITVYPSLFHWMPFWPQRINVHFKTLLVNPVLKPN